MAPRDPETPYILATRHHRPQTPLASDNHLLTMSSNFNKTSGSRFASGDQPVHLHEHSRPGGIVLPPIFMLGIETWNLKEDIWQDDEYDSSLSRSHMNTGSNLSGTGHSTARQGGGDHVIYTEKVTKEYDAQGNVIKTNVEHPKPGTLNGGFLA